MTKGELMETLKTYPDSAEIVLLTWHEDDEHCWWEYEIMNPILTNREDTKSEYHHPKFVGLLHSGCFVEEDTLYERS